jgi:D-amino-acid dehydrogenase
VIEPLGIRLPLAFKRGYHRHYRARGNAALTRPIVDIDYGYCLAPMDQGIRLTTGAEFAARDAKPTPVQFDRLLPAAQALFPLGEGVEREPWLGSRPCFADSRPVIGRAPGQDGLWLDYGHAHWGLTLGPVSGRLLAEMMTGATPFCDPKPYGAERFMA